MEDELHLTHGEDFLVRFIALAQERVMQLTVILDPGLKTVQGGTGTDLRRVCLRQLTLAICFQFHNHIGFKQYAKILIFREKSKN